jgi:hypothetical protein
MANVKQSFLVALRGEGRLGNPHRTPLRKSYPGDMGLPALERARKIVEMTTGLKATK